MSILFGIMAMEANKRRIFFSGVVAGMLVSIVGFLIYTNISAQRKLRLPDSADNIYSISIEESSCAGTLWKCIDDPQGIESIIDIFRQVEIDFSKPVEGRNQPGAIIREMLLLYTDRTRRTIKIEALGGDVVIYYPPPAESTLGYKGIWPGAENFFQNLDYPCKRLVYVEAD